MLRNFDDLLLLLLFIELFCDVIGLVEQVTWSHNGEQVAGTNGLFYFIEIEHIMCGRQAA